jgi:geranylgeranyl pyrophosphate synthase
VASGEILQLSHIGDLSTKPEDYYEIIDGKTAGPFATACSCAAIVVGPHEELVEPMWNYGMEMGRAFQLVDDLLDLIGDETTGKPRGTDVHEGKMTLPIIHALTVMHGAERAQLADVLTNFNDSRLRELTDLLDRAGSFDYSRLLISNHVGRAVESLGALPDSDAKRLLIEFAEMSGSRTN